MASGSGQFVIGWQRDPELGAKAIVAKFTFAGAGSQSFDLFQEMSARWIDIVKAVFIDNASIATSATLQFGTGVKISCPASSQGIFPAIVAVGDAQMTLTAGGAGTITLAFLNEDFPLAVWHG